MPTDYEYKLLDEDEKARIRDNQLRDVERQLFAAKVNLEGGAPGEQREQAQQQYDELRARAERLWALAVQGPADAPTPAPTPDSE